jgi:hypothetical protein
VRDVASSLARPRMPPNAFKTAPLVVLNGFQGGGQHLQLAAGLVQAMFPPISVQTVKLSACQVGGGRDYSEHMAASDFELYATASPNQRHNLLLNTNNSPPP